MATAGKIKFGTDGFRGIIADDFTFENVEKITYAISKYILETSARKTVLIGYDPRFMADKFAKFSAEILSDTGFRVLLSSKVVPTPVIAYAATVEADCAGALMFTASHNPKEYLGIKFIPNYGGPATKEITDRIVALINDGARNSAQAEGEIVEKDFSDKYFSHIESLIDFDTIRQGGVKFIYDGLFSASIGYFDKLLNRNHIKYEAFNLHYDPNFGGGLPEPKEKFMHYHTAGFLTLANDGDADRYGVMDENGEYISPNIIMAILLKYLKEKGAKGKMIKTVGVSQIIDITAKKLGIETITTPVGFKWLSEKMRENETILAGEDSGGLSTGCHIPEKDGIFANLLILEAVSHYKKPLYELKNEILKFAGTEFLQDRVDIKLKNDEEKKALMKKFSKVSEICGHKVFDTLKIDGVKFFFDKKENGSSSWILMRESGTEPLLRFYVETDCKENLEKIKEFIKNNI